MTAYALAADFELVEPTETATTEPTTAPTTEPTKDTQPDYLDDTYTDPDGEYTMRVSAEQTTIYFEDGRTANLPKGTALRLVALGSRWIQVRSEADGVIAYARMEDFVLDPTEAPTTEPTVEPDDRTHRGTHAHARVSEGNLHGRFRGTARTRDS